MVVGIELQLGDALVDIIRMGCVAFERTLFGVVSMENTQENRLANFGAPYSKTQGVCPAPAAEVLRWFAL